MASRRHLAVTLAVCLLAQAFALPAGGVRRKRDDLNNELVDSVEATSDDVKPESSSTTTTTTTTTTTENPFEDDDDDFSEPMQPASTGGGSNLFSLLRLAGALFPGSSGTTNPFLNNMIREILTYNQGNFAYNQGNPGYLFLRRQDIADNVINIDYVKDLKPPAPPFQRQESAEDDSSESDEDSSSDDDGGEESVEENKNGSVEDQSSDNASNSSDDFDDPPEGDGQGGGILGILAGLSGGEDGQSDLGDLLATISGIVGNLSGDGIDLNALIASGLGLFVGLLSEGDENPGAVIASYLLTSLESITGGGAQNNGAFFGNLVSKLVKGTSAVPGDDDESDENGGGKMPMSDSVGFFTSLLMGLLGDMSKGSSRGSSSPWRRREQVRDTTDQQQQSSPIWTFKMDVLRAVLQLGASIIGSASAGSINGLTT